MKTKHIITGLMELAAISIIVALTLTGCQAAPQKPPTKLEQHFFTVTTSSVPIVTIIGTNSTGEPITETRHEPVYDFKPNTSANAVTAIGGAAAAPTGWGALVGIVLGGAFGLWGLLRSRKANQTSAALMQIIETGSEVLKSTPQGIEADKKWKAWMVKHQAETGVIQTVTALIGEAVDNDAARGVAQKLLALMDPKPAT